MTRLQNSHLVSLSREPPAQWSCLNLHKYIREPVKNYLAIFSVKGVPPPPTPLTENHFAKKPLAERGGTPPTPLNRKSAKLFREFFYLKGLKMMFFH